MFVVSISDIVDVGWPIFVVLEVCHDDICGDSPIQGLRLQDVSVLAHCKIVSFFAFLMF